MGGCAEGSAERGDEHGQEEEDGKDMSIFRHPSRRRPALWTTMSGGLKPRTLAKKAASKRLRPRSASMAKKMDLYLVAKDKFLKARPWCFACKELRIMQQGSHSATEVHHRFGRSGKLLLDESGWVGVCRTAHCYIHDHPAEARKVGLIAPAGQWNRKP